MSNSAVWNTTDGRHIPYEMLTVEHLVNALNQCERGESSAPSSAYFALKREADRRCLDYKQYCDTALLEGELSITYWIRKGVSGWPIIKDSVNVNSRKQLEDLRRRGRMCETQPQDFSPNFDTPRRDRLNWDERFAYDRELHPTLSIPLGNLPIGGKFNLSRSITPDTYHTRYSFMRIRLRIRDSSHTCIVDLRNGEVEFMPARTIVYPYRG